MIRISNITKSFKDAAILKGVSLEVEQGAVTAIVGPSGSGKSTLLRCINFLERPDTGTIEIDGVRVDAATASAADILRIRSQTAMVFQQFNLFKNLTVLGNVLLGLTAARGLPKADAKKRALDLLEKVGLVDKLGAFPSQLSGGQQQRVAIARALALEPKVLLFDEPTSALDPELAEDVLQCIREVAQEGNTMLLVTHELGFAYDVASQIVLLDEGRISEQGPIRQFFHDPQTERGRQFLANAMKRFILSTDFMPIKEGEHI